MKVFNVEGDMFEAGKDFSTHDFEFNDMPVLAPATAKVTKELFEILLTHGQDIPKLVKALSARPDAELQLAEAQLPIQHLVCRRQYSQTAYRYGNFVAKFCLVPDTETQRKLREQTAEPEEGTDFLHRWLQDFYEANDAQYLFQVQLCEDLEDQPVEYAGKEWDATKYPWQTVAKLVIPKQDSFSPDRIKFWQDHMRVDPWLGLKSLQPLGSSNRLRRIGT